MKVKELITHLNTVASVSFELPDGTMVPAHFHVTEMGLMLKNYVDCGGKMRNERSATFQLWVAGDTAHRLMHRDGQGYRANHPAGRDYAEQPRCHRALHTPATGPSRAFGSTGAPEEEEGNAVPERVRAGSLGDGSAAGVRSAHRT